jgi:hypothetical protein
MEAVKHEWLDSVGSRDHVHGGSVPVGRPFSFIVVLVAHQSKTSGAGASDSGSLLGKGCCLYKYISTLSSRGTTTIKL